MTIMVVAGLTIVFYITCKVGRNKLLYISRAAADNLDSLRLEYILRTLSHIAGKHHDYSHLPQNRRYSTLASASFRRCHLAHIHNLAINHLKYRIICAMTEMIIHASISCRYCYLHNDYNYFSTFLPAATQPRNPEPSSTTLYPFSARMAAAFLLRLPLRQ